MDKIMDNQQNGNIYVFMQHQFCVQLGFGPVIWGNFCHQEGQMVLWGFE